MKKMGKKLISALLSLSLLITALPSSVFAESGTAAQGEAQETSGGGAIEELLEQNGVSTENTTNYYEVQFAWPEELSWLYEAEEVMAKQEEAEAETEADEEYPVDETEDEESPYESSDEEEITTLFRPETMMAEAGTLISSLPVPVVTGYVFLGWYYDAGLVHRAAEADVVDRNMTLYAGMAGSEDEAGELMVDFITVKDVEPDHAVYLASYTADEEVLRELVTLNDYSEADEEFSAYILEAIEPDLEKLIPDEELREQARVILELYKQGELLEAGDAGQSSETAAEAGEEAEAGKEAAADDAEEAKSGEEAEEAEGDEETGTATLTRTLLQAGIDQAVVLHLVCFYAPEELEQTDLYAEELEVQLKALGLTGEETQEEIIEVLKLSFEEDEELIAYLQDELGFAIETIEELEAMPAEDFFAQIAVHVRKTAEAADTEPFIFRLYNAGKSWVRGITYQIALKDTEKVRFVSEGEIAGPRIQYYNLTVYQEDHNDLRVRSDVIFLSADEVGVVGLNQALINLSMDENGDFITKENVFDGVLTYAGKLSVGDVVAVHNGQVNANNLSDGQVTYVKIVEDLGGGQYSYTMPDTDEVMFMPDNIPVRDDGSFEDGQILLTADQMSFTGELYEALDLGPDTVVERGDPITV